MTRAILTFHSIDDRPGVLSYPPGAFVQFIETLLKAEVPVVTFDELKRCRHGVTLTFDDGMRSVLDNALPVLRAFALPAHLFLTTQSVGHDNRWPSQPADAPRYEMLTWQQVELCAAHGMCIESHTATHPDLRTLSGAQIEAECATADADIERHCGAKPTLFAYPYGWFNATVAAAVAPRYTACLTTRLGYFTDSVALDAVPRIDTYYLQPAWLHRRLLSRSTIAYMGLRGLLRRLKGSE